MSWFVMRDTPTERLYMTAGMRWAAKEKAWAYPFATESLARAYTQMYSFNIGSMWFISDSLDAPTQTQHNQQTVLFGAVNPPEASKPKAALKIHICRRCNSENPYAEANQKDGTYVCFECRR